MSDLIPGLVGAIVGYMLGWGKEFLDRSRKRRAVATALILEIERHIPVLQRATTRGWVVPDDYGMLLSPITDRISDWVDLFDANTVEQVLQYRAVFASVHEHATIIFNRMGQQVVFPHGAPGYQKHIADCVDLAEKAVKALRHERG